jgi:lycopene cyclase domain-containing protein
MPAKFTYLLVDFFCILFPLLFSFHPKILFFKQWKYFFQASVLTAALFIGWDILFTYLGVWGFNSSYVVGFYFFNLPLEELLFFICIPYACVFTYCCLKAFFDFSPFNKKARFFSLILISSLLVTAVLNFQRLYTSSTFILLSFLLGFLTFTRVKYLAVFFATFLLILIPFFISNGILTGSFTGQAVVRYGNHYNLGLRMFTIPLEDTFYGMLLMLMNVWLYEFFLEREMGKAVVSIN